MRSNAYMNVPGSVSKPTHRRNRKLRTLGQQVVNRRPSNRTKVFNEGQAFLLLKRHHTKPIESDWNLTCHGALHDALLLMRSLCHFVFSFLGIGLSCGTYTVAQGICCYRILTRRNAGGSCYRDCSGANFKSWCAGKLVFSGAIGI